MTVRTATMLERLHEIINRGGKFDLRMKRGLREAFELLVEPNPKVSYGQGRWTVEEIDMSLGNVFETTIYSGKTLTFTNLLDGQHYTVIIHCDDAGSGSLSWTNDIKWPGGVEPTFIFQGNSTYIYSFVVDQNLDLHGRLAYTNYVAV